MKWLNKYGKGDIPSQDDMCNQNEMLDICRAQIKPVYEELIKEANDCLLYTSHREGSMLEPNLKVVLSNGLIVERKGKNSDLKVTDPSGQKGGQGLLDQFEMCIRDR